MKEVVILKMPPYCNGIICLSSFTYFPYTINICDMLDQPSIQTIKKKFIPENPFRSYKLRQTIRQPPSKSRLSLDPNFYGLHGAKGNISNHLGRSRTRKIDKCFVFCCKLGSSYIRVVFLKKFIEPKLAGTLSTVTKQSWHPTPEEASSTLLLKQHTKARRDALVLCRVNLNSDIKYVIN